MTESNFKPAPATRDQHVDQLLTPKNSLLTLMDYQPEIIAGVESIDRALMINNIVALTKTAKLFDMPIALSTVAVEAGYNHDTIKQIREIIPDVKSVYRLTVNPWEDEEFR